MYESNAYASETGTALEAYVKKQMGGAEYDFEANKALMKYYQYFPEKVNAELVVNVLMLACMAMPAADFLVLVSVAPGAAMQAQGVSAVREMVQALEQGHFKAFWNSYASSALSGQALIPSGFEDKIRAFVLSSVQQTFANIDKSLVGGLLQLNGSALDATLSKSPFVQDSGSANVVMAPCTGNQVTKKKTSNGMKLDEVMNLIDLV